MSNPPISSLEKKRYEFSYRSADGVHFVVLWDTNIQSAAERVLCRKVERDEVQRTETGNYIVDAHCVKEGPAELSGHFMAPTVDPKEVKSHGFRSAATDKILEGLV
jgi:hypothetical protein